MLNIKHTFVLCGKEWRGARQPERAPAWWKRIRAPYDSRYCTYVLSSPSACGAVCDTSVGNPRARETFLVHLIKIHLGHHGIYKRSGLGERALGKGSLRSRNKGLEQQLTIGIPLECQKSKHYQSR